MQAHASGPSFVVDRIESANVRWRIADRFDQLDRRACRACRAWRGRRACRACQACPGRQACRAYWEEGCHRANRPRRATRPSPWLRITTLGRLFHWENRQKCSPLQRGCNMATVLRESDRRLAAGLWRTNGVLARRVTRCESGERILGLTSLEAISRQSRPAPRPRGEPPPNAPKGQNRLAQGRARQRSRRAPPWVSVPPTTPHTPKKHQPTPPQQKGKGVRTLLLRTEQIFDP